MKEETKMNTCRNYMGEFEIGKKTISNKVLYLFVIIWCVSMVVLLALSPSQNPIVNGADLKSFEKSYFLLVDD
ncbi:MAG: hypothetical protein ACD_21C00035G0006 [uncultured bacterium]|nr:MAG: hypothetical protein ACD_21C00035G0006 [uncultured bacterium]